MKDISIHDLALVDGAGNGPGARTYAACAGAVLFFDVPVANVFFAGQCLDGLFG